MGTSTFEYACCISFSRLVSVLSSVAMGFLSFWDLFSSSVARLRRLHLIISSSCSRILAICSASPVPCYLLRILGVHQLLLSAVAAASSAAKYSLWRFAASSIAALASATCRWTSSAYFSLVWQRRLEFTDCSRYLRCESFHADMSTPAALSVSVAINAVPSLHSYSFASLRLKRPLSTLLLMVHSILSSEAVSSSQGTLLGS